jgi:hypothetical protein
VNSDLRQFAWYRFRATFGRRWTGLLAVTLLTGLLGGLSMGAIAAARTTESSFVDFALSAGRLAARTPTTQLLRSE